MSNTDLNTYIVNDQPTEKDALDFMPYVETLADIIQTGNTPLTIGVFGTWGSGKTSLMRMVKNGIPDSKYKGLPQDYTIAWFDAWKYDKEESLWRAFLLCVLSAIKDRVNAQGKPTDEFEKLQSLIYRDIEIEKIGNVTIDLAKLGGVAAKGLAQLSLSFVPGLASLTKLVDGLQSGAAKNVDEATGAIRRERTKIHLEQIQFLEQFQDKFRILIEQHVAVNGRLVVFVDDLDRCLPEKAIEVLESIKLFLDVKNCVFVLGLDQDVIARGIEIKYKEFSKKEGSGGQQRFTVEGIRYLEKIIQLPFQIPPVIQDDMGNFVEGLSDEWPHEECHKVFAEGLGDNPRQIKRTVNAFLMLTKLAEKREKKLKGQVKPIRLAKVVAIQAAHPDLFNLLLKEDPRYLRELEEYYRAEASEEQTMAKSKIDFQSGSDADAILIEPPPALAPFLSQRGIAAVRRILLLHEPEVQDANFMGLSTDDLKLYFTLTRSAEAPQAPPVSETARLVFEPQIVRIPAGTFIMGTTTKQAQVVLRETDNANGWQRWLVREQPQHKVELSEYFIGKYPVTNREYQAFVRDAKHNPPHGWDGDQFPVDKGSHPVVNISWDDSIAYCKWLSEKTKKDYRLPTEAEWEKAARGEDGRIYPWGDEFNPQKANARESKIGSTSDVGKFSPQGDSPYGCADMVGNVWEWCNDWFHENEYEQRQGTVVKNPQGRKDGRYRVMRGGSFSESLWDATRCSSRNRIEPSKSGNVGGFRVAFSPIITPEP